MERCGDEVTPSRRLTGQSCPTRADGEAGGALEDPPLLLRGQGVAVLIDPGARDRAHAH